MKKKKKYTYKNKRSTRRSRGGEKKEMNLRNKLRAKMHMRKSVKMNIAMKECKKGKEITIEPVTDAK